MKSVDSDEHVTEVLTVTSNDLSDDSAAAIQEVSDGVTKILEQKNYEVDTTSIFFHDLDTIFFMICEQNCAS